MKTALAHSTPSDFHVADGVSGEWRIETFTVSQQESDLTRMRAAIGGRYDEYCAPGVYRRLMRGRTVVMSNTQMELRTNRPIMRQSVGTVLINGLGLGVIVAELLTKPGITAITIIERSPDVIALVAPAFAHDSRVTIIQADAFQYQPPKGQRYDYVWHDIWDFICGDNLPQMTKLKRKYGRRTNWQACWAENECRC